MLTRKNIRISRAEALKYLFLEAHAVPGILAACISNLVVFGIVFGILYLGRFIQYSNEGFIVSAIFFLLFGIPQYFIKKQEFLLYEKTTSDIFLFDIFTLPLYLLLFGGLFTYYFVPDWISKNSGQTSVLTIVVTIFIVALIFSYVFNTIWKLVDFYLLGLFSGKDWFLMAEKDHFINVLAMRFQEAKRYSVPLSVVVIRLEIQRFNGSQKRLLDQIYRKISISLREIDTISHFNAWNVFYLLSPITQAAAKGMLDRMVRILQEMVNVRGIQADIIVESSVSAIRAETQTEFDLLQPNFSERVEVKSPVPVSK
jgi:hypothetical protein